MQPDTLRINNRYLVRGSVGKGGMGTVYRAHDRLHQQDIALKQVIGMADDTDTQGTMRSSMSQRVMLAHEFQTLASLHHPHIIRVLDYGFDVAKQPYFTMQLLPDAQPLTTFARNLGLVSQVNLLIETLQALAYLHHRGIIHRDMKPDNALVTPDEHVHVLDFGLAAPQGEDDLDEIAGTVAYIAPEILMGTPVSRASDIYAVGIMAFEIFAGYHPFVDDNPGTIIQNILYGEVHKEDLDVPDAVADIVYQMLERDPDDRYDDAYAVIRALSDTIDQPTPEETAAIRESYLQAAEFVGREAEMSRLLDALTAMLNDGQRSTWLIAGESGVGKSRLVEEVRVQAMVRGALVVHGEAIAEGGVAYQMWRTPLRRLLLEVDIPDLEAGVLRQIVPNIDTLLGREIPDVPHLDGTSGEQRLLDSIAMVFNRVEQPILLLLEDLQWTLESLDVLSYLSQNAPDDPLLIVGTYRDDERPNLPDNVPDAQVIKLERLNKEGIAALSRSMLGDEVGARSDLLGLLERETEGNAFFLVEVMRSLADDAGRLSDIGRMTIPAQIFAGGMQAVVQKRLSRVPQNARRTLHIAAVAGRHLNLDLLRMLTPDVDLDDWLVTCSNLAVLEVTDEQWRFAHAKIRDGVLDSLDPEYRRDLHIDVAEAMQALYAETVDEYAALLSDHYEQADDLLTASKWHARAGKHAENTWAIPLAARHYERAMQLWTTLGEIPDLGAGLLAYEVYNGLGMVRIWRTQHEQAVDTFERLHEAAAANGDLEWQAKSYYGIALVEVNQGHAEEALSLAEEGLALTADQPLSNRVALTWIKALAYYRLGQVPDAKATIEEHIQLADDVGSLRDKSLGLNLLGGINYAMGDYNSAIQHFEEAFITQKQLGKHGLAMASLNNVGYLTAARGDYAGAEDYYREAIRMAEEYGVRNAELIYHGNLGGVLVRQGRYQAAIDTLVPILRVAESVQLAEVPEMYSFLAEAYLGIESDENAVEVARLALEASLETNNPEYIGRAWRVLGQVSSHTNLRMTVATVADDEIDADTAFQHSYDTLDEASIKGEQAHTLREWAWHAFRQHDDDTAQERWQRAREIFQQVGAALEYERMPAHIDEA